jgi:hypothetical protein
MAHTIMLKWIREHLKYSRHQAWLGEHFQGNYITARDGDSILTAIVEKLEGVDPNGREFSVLAQTAIDSFTKPSEMYGAEVVAHWEFRSPPKEFKVPARFITIEAVRIQALYIRDLRQGVNQTR